MFFGFDLKNIVIFGIISCIFFGIIRLIFNLIDYILFKKIASLIIESIFENEDDSSGDRLKKPVFNSEDEWMKDKNRIKEQKEKEIEALQGININQKIEKKIVGISLEGKIVGKWTQKYINKMMQKWKDVDMNKVQEKIFNMNPDRITDGDLFRILNMEALKQKQRGSFGNFER